MIVDPFNTCLPCCYGLFLCLLLGGVGAEDVEATVGVDVTLVCRYDAKHYGRLGVCWGRGAIPNSGCTDEILRGDGTTVISRVSERYLLMGDLAEGDVSLVIRQVQESDAGMYGCRVDIPGWFNDHKHQMTLTVVPGPPHPPRVQTREVKERMIGVSWTRAFDGGSPVTSYSVAVKREHASWNTAETTAGISPTQSQVTLSDLRPATVYNIRMFAMNSVGRSEASGVLTVTTEEAAPAGPPLDVRLRAFSPEAISVIWEPPKVGLRNGVLRHYSVRIQEESDPPSPPRRVDVAPTGLMNYVAVFRLKPSTNYSVVIQARTSAGLGPPSPPSFCATLEEVVRTSTAETTLAATVWGQSTTGFTAVPPDPPVVSLVSVSDQAITVRWTAGSDGGSPITAYELDYKEVNGSWDSSRTVREAPDVRETTILETHYSTLFYNIRMFARNSVGFSEASNILTVTMGRSEHTTTHPPLGQATTQDGVRGNLSTTVSTDTQASVGGGRSGHLTAIVVPVVLVVLIVAIVSWQLQRMKVNKGGSPLAWLARYRNSEPITEL